YRLEGRRPDQLSARFRHGVGGAVADYDGTVSIGQSELREIRCSWRRLCGPGIKKSYARDPDGFREPAVCRLPPRHVTLKNMRIWLIVLAVGCSFLAAAADKQGAVKARGKPSGAGLFVDGKYIGPAGRFTVPEKYQVDPGEHEISL